MNVEYLLNKAKRDFKGGKFQDSLDTCDTVLAKFPGNVSARQIKAKAIEAQSTPEAFRAPPGAGLRDQLGRALSYAERKDFDQAIELLLTLQRRSPDSLDIKLNLASIYFNAGAPDQAEQIALDVVESGSENFAMLLILGHGKALSGDREAALDYFRRASRIPGLTVDDSLTLGNAFVLAGSTNEALKVFVEVLDRASDNADAYLKIGELLRRVGESQAALKFLQKAESINPNSEQISYSLGTCNFTLRNIQQAEKYYIRAIELSPDFVSPYLGLASCRSLQEEREDAIKLLKHVLVLDPKNEEAISNLIQAETRNCEWETLERYQDTVEHLGIGGVPVIPFNLLALDENSMNLRKRAEFYSGHVFSSKVNRTKNSPTRRASNIKLGFYSSDLYDHATLFLIIRLFELIDKSKFDVHIFSYGGGQGGVMRQRLLQADVKFFDVSGHSDPQIAEVSRQLGIEIAVDLKGHTSGSRLGIFSYGAAPVQIHYLGYPGTLGTDFIDYFIADPVVVPDDWRESFSEKIIFLPNSYQATDNQRRISDAFPTRRSVGIPDDKFVFASFNDPFKITPHLFSVWAEIIKSAEDSVLWIYAPREGVVENLQGHALDYGIEKERLIFAGKMDQADHLARLKHADLFLDSFICSAHTTASDALWAGLPLVTLKGSAFQGRVAASLLSSAGLPELITESEEQYKQSALDLYRDRAKLTALKNRLSKTLKNCALFDSERFARHFEVGLMRAYQRYLDALEPEHIHVENADGMVSESGAQHGG